VTVLPEPRCPVGQAEAEGRSSEPGRAGSFLRFQRRLLAPKALEGRGYLGWPISRELVRRLFWEIETHLLGFHDGTELPQFL